MRIGNFVYKKGSRSNIGFISERPAVSYCWNVRWVKGNNRGSSSIVREDDLVLIKRETK
jgi:hypothetical protein